MRGTVRPESSVVREIFSGFTTIIPASGGPGDGAADFCLLQPDIDRANTTAAEKKTEYLLND
jgi:hypothetical protein